MLPLLGHGKPAVGWVAGVLALRLALNAWRAWLDPLYRRPAAFALDAVLIVALLTLGRG